MSCEYGSQVLVKKRLISLSIAWWSLRDHVHCFFFVFVIENFVGFLRFVSLKSWKNAEVNFFPTVESSTLRESISNDYMLLSRMYFLRRMQYKTFSREIAH